MAKLVFALGLLALLAAMTPGAHALDEGKNATCVVTTEGGAIYDNSTKTCLGCQLQCLTLGGCGYMIFDGQNITRKQLATHRCAAAQQATSFVDLCALEDGTGYVIEGVLRGCKACMARCGSVGQAQCATAIWAGAAVAHADLATYANTSCPPDPSPSPYNPPSPSPYNPPSPVIPSPMLPSPSPAPLNCSEPVMVGMGRAALERFFFNSTSKACEKFLWGGMDGNTNRFLTELDCMIGCTKSPAPVVPVPVAAPAAAPAKAPAP